MNNEVKKISPIEKARFESLTKRWEEHCEVTFSPSIELYLNCDAVKEIVAMGRNVLPLIAERYRVFEDKINGNRAGGCYISLSGLVKKIVGNDFQIPEEAIGNVRKMHTYTIKWIDENVK